MKLNVTAFKELMKNQDLTQGELVEKLQNLGIKISLDAVKFWTRNENPSTPSLQIIFALSEILMVKPDVLISEGKIVGYIDVKKVPIIGISSCGSPITNDYQSENEFAYYRGEFWSKDLYCVIACGDSMSPDIEDGDEVICDPKRKPQHGDIVEYKIYNERAIKIYVEDTDANIIQLIPYNPSPEFKIRTIRLDDYEANDLTIAVVVAVNKLRFQNRKIRLKMIGRT